MATCNCTGACRVFPFTCDSRWSSSTDPAVSALHNSIDQFVVRTGIAMEVWQTLIDLAQARLDELKR